MNTDTPETDAMVSADQHHLEDDNFFSASVYWRMCDLARHIERELTAVTEQRDRLAEALQNTRCVFCGETQQTENEKAYCQEFSNTPGDLPTMAELLLNKRNSCH